MTNGEMVADREYLGRQMAELHFILLTKRDNHGLDASERSWLEASEKYYSEFHATLDKDAILFALARARVMDQVMASTISGNKLEVQNLQRIRHALYSLDKRQQK